MGLTRSTWVRLDPCDGLGYVGFFNPLWWVGMKKPLNPTFRNDTHLYSDLRKSIH